MRNGTLAVVQPIPVACARRGYIGIPEPAPMLRLRTAVSKEKKERSGKKREERQ